MKKLIIISMMILTSCANTMTGELANPLTDPVTNFRESFENPIMQYELDRQRRVMIQNKIIEQKSIKAYCKNPEHEILCSQLEK